MSLPLHFQVSEKTKKLLTQHSQLTLIFVDVDSADAWRRRWGDEVARNSLKELGDSAVRAFSAIDSLYYDRDEYLIWMAGSMAEQKVTRLIQDWLQALGERAPSSCTSVICELSAKSKGLGHLHQDLMISMTNAKTKGRGKIHRLDQIDEQSE